MNPGEEGYVRCLRQMAELAKHWIRCRGTDGLSFSLPPAEAMIICPLNAVGIGLIADNETTRELLQYVDEQSQNEGTIFQMGVVVRTLRLPFVTWSESKLAALVAQGAALA